MYKQIRINKKWSVSIETFNDFCRKNIDAYKTGYHKYIATDFIFYFFVLYKFRITLSKDRDSLHCANN